MKPPKHNREREAKHRALNKIAREKALKPMMTTKTDSEGVEHAVEALGEEIKAIEEAEPAKVEIDFGVSAADAALHFPGFAIDDLYRPDGRWQTYRCVEVEPETGCGYRWGMRLLHRGTTPMMMACPNCRKTAHSTGQHDTLPPGHATSPAEWRQLTIAEMEGFKKKDPGYYQHLQMGGLGAVHIGQPAISHRPTVAEKLPGRNEGCPCGSGKKFKSCCSLVSDNERLERWAKAKTLAAEHFPGGPSDQESVKLLPTEGDKLLADAVVAEGFNPGITTAKEKLTAAKIEEGRRIIDDLKEKELLEAGHDNRHAIREEIRVREEAINQELDDAADEELEKVFSSCDGPPLTEENTRMGTEPESYRVFDYLCRDCRKMTRRDKMLAMTRCHYCNGKALPLRAGS